MTETKMDGSNPSGKNCSGSPKYATALYRINSGRAFPKLGYEIEVERAKASRSITGFSQD